MPYVHNHPTQKTNYLRNLARHNRYVARLCLETLCVRTHVRKKASLETCLSAAEDFATLRICRLGNAWPCARASA